MKFVQLPDLDPSADTDKDAKGWSLSWRPDDRCDSFTREAILDYAPPASGVYGLFNFDCQLFIGESANIREVLLRLEMETDFQSPHLRPTGFTFELCSEESRQQKAAELIAQYRPALQTMAAPNDLSVSENQTLEPSRKELQSPPEPAAENHEFPMHGEVAPKVHRTSQPKRAQTTVLLAILLSAGTTGYYFFAPTESARDVQGSVTEQSSAHVPRPPVSSSGQAEVNSKSADVSVAKPVQAKWRDEEIPEKMHGAVRLANASGLEDSGLQKLTTPAQTNRTSEQPEKKWSVQISAVPARDVADRLSQELIAKGYNSYVVPAEVKGQAYYRVRAGRFDAREDAESMRQSLVQQEAYRDAYVTSD